MNNATPNTAPPTESKMAWRLVIIAAALLMITMGIRQTVGLFVHPIAEASANTNAQTLLDIVDISFALAVGQLMWGVFQPLFGVIADKRGSFAVLAAGAVLLAIGQVGTIWAHSFWPLLLTMGLMTPAGAAAGSFSVLIGATASRLPPRLRSFASGFINAGGSAGQFIFAPLVQAFISLWGYFSALIMLAIAALATIPLARGLCAPTTNVATTHSPANAPSVNASGIETPGLKAQLLTALRNPSYLLLHAGFFTCGFHVAFLVTHLPGEVAHCGLTPAVSAVSLSLIGLCNIAGSLLVGVLGNHYRMKSLLALIYASRALMITTFLLSPKDALSFYIFAAATGFTWLATVPPTAGIVGKLFGTRYLATLFGLTLLTHQIGGFLGAYLGGLAIAHQGDYQWMWYADIALASLAALLNLPIKEKPLERLATA